MYCVDCGAEIQKGADFCIGCGRPLAAGGKYMRVRTRILLTLIFLPLILVSLGYFESAGGSALSSALVRWSVGALFLLFIALGVPSVRALVRRLFTKSGSEKHKDEKSS